MCSHDELKRALDQHFEGLKAFDTRLNECSAALVRLTAQFESYQQHIGVGHSLRLDRLEQKGLELQSEVNRAIGKSAVWTAIILVVLQSVAGVVLAKVWGVSLG